MDRQTDRQKIDKETDGQTDRQTDRQKIDREIDGQTDRHPWWMYRYVIRGLRISWGARRCPMQMMGPSASLH